MHSGGPGPSTALPLNSDKTVGQDTADEANARFADWFYVIPSSSFENLHLNRRDLVVKTEA